MGVYGGFVDKMPFGAAFNKGLTFRMDNGQKYMNMLLELVLNGKLDPSFVAPHLALRASTQGYEIFSKKKTTASGCTQTIRELGDESGLLARCQRPSGNGARSKLSTRAMQLSTSTAICGSDLIFTTATSQR